MNSNSNANVIVIVIVKKLTNIKWHRALFDALLPPRCALCAAVASGGFCGDCRELLPWISAACEICGAEMQVAGVCGECLAHRPHYDHAVIPFRYRAPIAGQIQTFKYQDRLRNVAPLAAGICARVWQQPTATPLPDVIVPVPLHQKRLRQRGFNQALLLARAVGDELGVDVNGDWLARVKHTKTQTGLGKRARAENVRGAFVAADRPPPFVALIDDVVTSGSTVNACARALKNAGVESVGVWAAART